MEKGLLAGAGKSVIQFPEDYFPTEGFLGVHDDISARVLILEEKIRFVLVSLELPSLKPQELIDELRSWVGEMTGCMQRQVWITVTHNTSAPHVPQISKREDDRQRIQRKWEIHIQIVKKAIEKAAKKALHTMCQARMGIGTGKSTVNVNRDIQTARGWWVGKNPDGYSDKSLTVIKVEDTDGKLLAALFHYAIKSMVIDDAPMMDGWRYSSADVTGEASRYLENKMKAPAIFLMGASGDQVPREMTFYYERDLKGELYKINRMNAGFAIVEQLGVELGADVEKILNSIICNIDCPDFRMEKTEYVFDGQIPFKGNYPVLAYEWKKEGKQVIEAEFLCMDDIVLIGMKPEVMSKTGVELKERSPFKYSLLCTMVNGNQNYMADKKSFERFGFEALHSCVVCGAAEDFVQQQGKYLDVLYKMRNL